MNSVEETRIEGNGQIPQKMMSSKIQSKNKPLPL